MPVGGPRQSRPLRREAGADGLTSPTTPRLPDIIRAARHLVSVSGLAAETLAGCVSLCEEGAPALLSECDRVA